MMQKSFDYQLIKNESLDISLAEGSPPVIQDTRLLASHIHSLNEQTTEWSLSLISPCSSPLTRENIDLNRVPQVIHEASCHTTHSCTGLENAFGLETIPVSLRMPVLRKNPSCFPTASYSLEFELITVACMCAIARHSWTGLTALIST